MRQAFAAKRWLLPASVYLLAWVCTLLAALGTLAADSMAVRRGRLRQTELQLADFELVNAVTESETGLVSVNEDPQMRYRAGDNQQLQSLTVALEYDKYPYERCLYYTTAPGEEFGQDKRVWAEENPDGSLTFSLPRGVNAIRLDPGSRMNLHMEFSRITLNADRSAASYFLPDGGDCFALLVLPGLAAAAVQWAADFFGGLRRGTEKGEKK